MHSILSTAQRRVAVAEELFFRGFLITRLMTAFGGGRFSWILAVLIPAVIFGFGHVYYQGMRGLVMTGAIT